MESKTAAVRPDARMEPAHSIIQRLGGEAKVSDITGTAYTSPYRWQAPQAKGGTDGWIPRRHHDKLLAYAKAENIPLAPSDFLNRTAAMADETVGEG